MRVIAHIASCVAVLAATCAADTNTTSPHASKQILPHTFQPPQVFQHANLVRTVNLEKLYSRETVNVVVENIAKEPQAQYYIPFQVDVIARVGSLEVKDKNDATRSFPAEVVEIDNESSTEYYKVDFTTPIPAGEKITLSITYSVLSSLQPLPATIEQTDKQYVQYTFSAYTPSAYKTLKQKTTVKLSTPDVPDYTIVGTNAENKEDPEKQGTKLIYGPYVDVPAGVQQMVSIRYDFTKPLLHATLLERDIEVSHWGGNLATEERYWLENRGATLKKHFSRVTWQQTSYYNPASSAARELVVPLAPGSLNPYFTDDIGNVSTSRFRSSARDALLELKPRYPLFGGWKYSFKIGWDANLETFLRKLKTGDSYVLKVPFLQGPKQSEGVEYEKVNIRVILPEGATNVKFDTTASILSSETSVHRTFMDTLGRTTLEIKAINVIDEARDKDIVVTYDYPVLAGFRKPLVIFASVISVFGAAWFISQLDVSIGRKKA